MNQYALQNQAFFKEIYLTKHNIIMHKLLIILTLSMAACNNSAEISEPSSQTITVATSRGFSLPSGYAIVEQSDCGYFIRLSSAERATVGTIREVAESLSGKFDRVDLCLDIAHERGDEYLSIIDGKVFDYANNNIYSLNTISK